MMTKSPSAQTLLDLAARLRKLVAQQVYQSAKAFAPVGRQRVVLDVARAEVLRRGVERIPTVR